jgi:hypothetical protein
LWWGRCADSIVPNNRYAIDSYDGYANESFHWNADYAFHRRSRHRLREIGDCVRRSDSVERSERISVCRRNFWIRFWSYVTAQRIRCGDDEQ